MSETQVYHGRSSYNTVASIVDDGAIRSPARRRNADPETVAAAEAEIERWVEDGYTGHLHDELSPDIQEECGVETVEGLFDEYGVWLGKTESDGKMYATRVDDETQVAGGYLELSVPEDAVGFAGSYGVTAGEISIDRAERIVLHSYNGEYARQMLEERVGSEGVTADVELSPMQLSIVENVAAD